MEQSMENTNNAIVFVGDGVVTIKRKGTSTTVVANILGTDVQGNRRSIYLDRLVHELNEEQLGEFIVKGAISSILIDSVTKQ
jgi:hypothetical protein